MREFFVCHQEDGFDFRCKVMVGHHHGEFGRDVGEWADASYHDPCVTPMYEFNGEASKRFDPDIRQVCSNLLKE